jgi:hypothetical protein
MRLTQPPLQLRAVETAHDRVANCCRFNGVIGFAHARGQLRKLLPAELALSIELICKTDHAELFFQARRLISSIICCAVTVKEYLCGWSYGIRY